MDCYQKYKTVGWEKKVFLAVYFPQTLQKRLQKGENGNQVIHRTSLLYETQHEILTRKGNCLAKVYFNNNSSSISRQR